MAGSKRWRRPVLTFAARVASAPILRLCLGRWPDAQERRLFSSAFVAGEAVVPPILRGLHAVPAAKRPLGQLAVLNLVREGVVRKPPDFGQYRVPAPPHAGNPLSYWNGAPLSFLHFEKAAGTSLASVLTELFHPLQIDDDPQRGTAAHILSAFPPTILDEIRRKKLVWGHYDLPALRRLDPDRIVVTLLREPVARILSLYHFWRSVDPALVQAGLVNFNVAAAHELGLLDFLRTDEPLIRNYIDNVYVRRLAGAYAVSATEDPLSSDPAATLAEALHQLRSIGFVGIVEQIEACLGSLGQLIGARFPTRLPSENSSAANAVGAAPGYRSIPRERITPDVRSELERLTALDEVVYRTAVMAWAGRR